MKKICCCAIAVFVGMVLLGFLCIVFYDRLFVLHSTYQMTRDPKTKSEVEERIGVVFPDSVKWEKCYFFEWNGDFTFNAKLSIPEKDFEELLPSDIDFEHFNDDIHIVNAQKPITYFLAKQDMERYLGVKMPNNLEVFYYKNTDLYLFFCIDRTNTLPHDRIFVYVSSEGPGYRLGTIVLFPE